MTIGDKGERNRTDIVVEVNFTLNGPRLEMHGVF